MTDTLDAIATPGEVDDASPQSSLDKVALQRRWVLEIDRYERKASKFKSNGKLVLQRFTGEKKDINASEMKFNFLWSNIETLQPALYARDPQPEVDRRFKDRDPIGRVASDVLERTITCVISTQPFGEAIRQAINDRLLPGRGIVWPRYVPHFKKVEGEAEASQSPGAVDVTSIPNDAANGEDLTSDAPEDVDEVEWEEVRFDFVPWTDFGHTVARTWEEVTAVWRVVYLDKQEIKQRFSDEIAEAIPYDQKPDGLDKDAEGAEIINKARLYEIWDRRTKRVIRLCKEHTEVLEVQEDPLELDGFWPLPKPLQARTTSRSFLPTADYIHYLDQAKELDRLTDRISKLTRALKIVGVCDKSTPELADLLNNGKENVLVPVDGWAAFAERGGLEGAVQLLPVKDIADVLVGLYEARDKVKADLYEISGLSDLLRGASDPEDTATAQKIKANFASVRLKEMQRQVQSFVRDLIRIAAEIVCGQFGLDTIKQMCGVELLTEAEKQAIAMQQQVLQHYQQQAQAIAQQQPQPGQAPVNPVAMLGPQPPAPPADKLKLMDLPSWEQVEALLRDKPARTFRIDIETDSTILQDERAEQEARLGFAETIGKLLQATEQIVATVPEMAQAAGETFMFVLRAYKVGRPTEAAFSEAVEKLVAKAAQPQNKPSPEQIKVQGDLAVTNAKIQGDLKMEEARQQTELAKINANKELETFKAQLDMKVEQFKQDAQQRQAEQENALEAQRVAFQSAQDERLERMRMAMEAAQARSDQQLQVILAHIKAASAVEVAEIGAQTTLEAAQISAANQSQSGDD